MKTDEFSVSLSTSKGTQSKWHIGDIWYKRDYLGAEGASEYVVSCLLAASNIQEFACYTPVSINKKFIEQTFTKHTQQSIYKIGTRLAGTTVNTGCISNNFLEPNEEIITIYRLLQAYSFLTPRDEKNFDRLSSQDKIIFVVRLVSEVLGVRNFGEYLTAMLELDTVIRNEDRHLNNICLVRNTVSNSYKTSPVFDNGLSLLSDYGDYTWDESMIRCLKRVKAKPFNISFDKQVEAAEALYGQQLWVDVSKLDWENMAQSILNVYKDQKFLRCLKVLKYQLDKYPQYTAARQSEPIKLDRMKLE